MQRCTAFLVCELLQQIATAAAAFCRPVRCRTPTGSLNCLQPTTITPCLPGLIPFRNNINIMDINKFLSKLFGNKSTRDMKLIQPWVEKVKAAYPAIQALDNDALRAKTKELQATIQSSANDLKVK